MSTDKFEQWCILEIMGHQTYAGFVTEQSLGGSSFVRIDVPECGSIPAFSKLFGATSIYCITPVSEEVAKLRAQALKQAPLSIFDLPEAVRDRLRAAPALNAPVPVPASRYDDDEDDDLDLEDEDEDDDGPHF